MLSLRRLLLSHDPLGVHPMVAHSTATDAAIHRCDTVNSPPLAQHPPEGASQRLPNFKSEKVFVSQVWVSGFPETRADFGGSPGASGQSETGRIRFRRVRFQTPNSVSYLALAEFRGASSVSSSQPIICVQNRTHRAFGRTHRVCPKTQ